MKGLDKRVRPCACVLDRRAAEGRRGGRGQRAEAWMKRAEATGQRLGGWQEGAPDQGASCSVH